MTHIRQRRDTASNWAATNPVLQLGEVGWETDTRRAKLGDGVNDWNTLLYATRPINAVGDVPGLQAALDAKAGLNSPLFTGDPKAPTPATSDNDTSVATTAFVRDVLPSGLWTIGDASLPGRLKSNAFSVTDWNTALSNGWYRSIPGATNGPAALAAEYLLGIVQRWDTNSTVQTVQSTNPVSPNSRMYQRRGNDAGVWSAWQQMTPYRTELDERYAQLASPTFTGDPKAPTPAISDSDTSIATTAFVKAVLLAAHPVGTIRMQTVNTNPSTFIGGTWVAWGTGRVPVGINTGQTEFDTVEETGGSMTHTHGKGALITTAQGAAGPYVIGDGNNVVAASSLPPYIVCYMFKRTA